LDPEAAVALREAGFRVTEDQPVHTTALNLGAYPTPIPEETGAAALHAQGIYGSGVTIAFIDTGLWRMPATQYDVSGKTNRLLAQFDATVPDTSNANLPVKSRYAADIGDPGGHGTHVTSIATSSWQHVLTKTYEGVAPGANVVSVRAFNKDGSGTYESVVAALNWVIQYRNELNIRVLNLSFAADPQSWYWDDPINRAVMAAWRAGIVVVAAAGNRGPTAMSVGVPGNVPYVITVGAYTDSYTPMYAGGAVKSTDDHLATFSSAGPTYEGFVKPDVIALGGHVVAEMQSTSDLYKTHLLNGLVTLVPNHFMMSGTSQSTAVVSGVVALMLQQDPTLTPDDVKCRLMVAAVPAQDASGAPLYSVFQQGAGAISAVSAVRSTESGCANQGLDVNADLAGTAHFGGAANLDASGNYFLMNDQSPGTVWNGSSAYSQGMLWVPPSKPKTASVTTVGFDWSTGLWQGALIPTGFQWPQAPGVMVSGQISNHPLWMPQQ
jgi:serine protease AprX